MNHDPIRYATDSVYREAKRAKNRRNSRLRRADPIKRAAELERARISRQERYASDPTYRERLKTRANEAYRENRTDPEFREKRNYRQNALERGKYATNPDHRRRRLEAGRKFRLQNPGVDCAKTRRRHCAKAQRTPPWADGQKIKIIYRVAAQMQRELGVKLHVDHVIPLRGSLVSGLHVENNLQIVPAVMNRAKRNLYVVR